MDRPKRKRVTIQEFEQVLENVGNVVGDMLRLIWCTAMRPSEVCIMRPIDIICNDPECWLYIPGRDTAPTGKHKTMRFGRIKAIPLTQESQIILRTRVKDFKSKDYIFSPKESISEFLEEKAGRRITPSNCGNRLGTNKRKHPMITPGN